MSSVRLSPQDLLFIYGETSSSKMHVAGLLPFTPPADAPRDYLRRMIDEARRQEVVAPWNRKLAHPRLQFSPLHSWVEDVDFDFDYHVRRSALASPGDERELGILVSRLHSNHLDLTRPPWELHVIEGLEGGRFALYMKIHHALVDGYSAMRMLGRSLSKDRESQDVRMFFNVPTPVRPPREAGTSNPLTATLRALGGLGSTVTGGGSSAIDLTNALVKTQIRRDGEYAHIAGSASAPHSILNARISRNRRFATQQYEFDRLGYLVLRDFLSPEETAARSWDLNSPRRRTKPIFWDDALRAAESASEIQAARTRHTGVAGGGPWRRRPGARGGRPGRPGRIAGKEAPRISPGPFGRSPNGGGDFFGARTLSPPPFCCDQTLR